MPTNPAKLLNEWTRERLVQAYRQGVSTRVLAAGAGVSKATVTRLLRSAGVEVRKVGRMKRELKEQLMGAGSAAGG